MSEEKSIEELAVSYAVNIHSVELNEAYNSQAPEKVRAFDPSCYNQVDRQGHRLRRAFIAGAKAQRRMCDADEAHRWSKLLKHLVREGLLTQEDIEDIRRGL